MTFSAARGQNGVRVDQAWPHLLVYTGGDLLQEVGHPFAGRHLEAERVEEGHHPLLGSIVDGVACSETQQGIMQIDLLNRQNTQISALAWMLLAA